jgi:hypothetical protein
MQAQGVRWIIGAARQDRVMRGADQRTDLGA